MSKITQTAVSTLLFLLTLLVLSGCDYSTRIISSADSPDVIFDNFISAMKEKDFDKANSYLADGASVTPVNDTGFSFFDCFIDVSLGSLSCRTLEQPVIHGTGASIDRVRITSLDKSKFIDWANDNILGIQHEYMVQHNVTEFDSKDRKAVGDLLSVAFNEYAKDAGTLDSVIKVDFVYTGGEWKIIGSDDLIAAIFGGI